MRYRELVEDHTIPTIPPEIAQKILSDRRVKHGVKVGAKTRLWRGQSKSSGSGMATLGLGLYFTASRRVTKGYAGDDGEVVEISHRELPDNALRFDSINDFEIWEQTAARLLGFDAMNKFRTAFYDYANFIRALDPNIDGIQMYTGPEAFFVRYP